KDIKKEIVSMPGIYQQSIEHIVAEAKEVHALGIPAVILFGIPEHKDEDASEAYSDDAAVQNGVRALKEQYPDLIVITDVCLCEYTSHGHCGVVRDGGVLNDPTLELLARTAVSHARAGADIVAPSDMMDGRVAAIRAALDEAGGQHVAILSYTAKYASAFYGPFRDAADSTPRTGDRRGYQMDSSHVRQGLAEIAADLAEGADVVMVKPALAYLDVIRAARERFDAPLAAYSVSGEYAMLAAAAERGWLDHKATVLESLTAIVRAGADIVITYSALEAARWLR
ncbi:MAG: porphobilinogen synthase, partial [Gemmatimonadetes bacterium]|nr:porphobilinogen synthase [Gemmatimonadota bacterium]